MLTKITRQFCEDYIKEMLMEMIINWRTQIFSRTRFERKKVRGGKGVDGDSSLFVALALTGHLHIWMCSDQVLRAQAVIDILLVGQDRDWGEDTRWCLHMHSDDDYRWLPLFSFWLSKDFPSVSCEKGNDDFLSPSCAEGNDDDSRRFQKEIPLWDYLHDDCSYLLPKRKCKKWKREVNEEDQCDYRKIKMKSVNVLN